AWLAKTDDLGNTQWEMSIGDYNMLNNTGSPYVINAVLQGQDGGYVVTGYKEVLNSKTDQRSKYLLILKTDGRNFGASGRITTSDGSPVSGVKVDFTIEEGEGVVPIAVTTDSNGNWQQTGFETGTKYSATPQKTAYIFTERNLLIQKSGDRYNFTATSFFTASGQVTGADGSAVANVTIRFKTLTGVGSVPEAVKTDAEGRWSQTDFLPGVTYVVTPEGKGLNVNPAYKTFSAANTALDFIAGTGYDVSGRVLTQDSQPLAGVTINFARLAGSGSTPSSVTTDANGRWNQKGFATGTTYRVVPQRQGYSFIEDSKDFSRANTALNFRAVSGFAAGGRITVLTPRGEFPIKGVKIEFSSVSGTGNVPVSVMTDTNGQWQQDGFFNGSIYRVTPVVSASAGYTMPGLARTIGIGATSYVLTPSYFEVDSRNISLNCQVTLGYTASGQATGADGQPLPGVAMTFSQVRGTGSIPQPVITDSEGHWSQSGFQDGTEYRVTPGKDNSVFTPENRAFSNISSDLDFTAGSAYAVSGQVTMDNAQPLSGVSITFTKSQGTGNPPAPVITGADGRFSQLGFTQGVGYQVRAEKRGYVLTPTVLNINSSGSYNFSARADWSGTWNTNWGMVTFTQNGSQVTGTYPGWSGRITATVSGDGVSGRWSESDFASNFEVQLSADGNTFAGDWIVTNGQRGSWTYFGGNRIVEITSQH
ncbi:MAG: hypothetical protein CVU87_14080, partial [Firmicutes bacterium HGW-Firmicutes-12]